MKCESFCDYEMVWAEINLFYLETLNFLEICPTWTYSMISLTMLNLYKNFYTTQKYSEQDHILNLELFIYIKLNLMICEIQVYIQKSFIGWKKRRDFNCVETNIITIQTTRALKSVHIDIIELLIIENVTGHSTLHNLGDS